MLFGNPVGAATIRPGENALVLSVVRTLVVTAVFLPLAVRASRGLSR